MLIELKLVNSDFSPKEKLFSKHSTVKFAYSKEKEKHKWFTNWMSQGTFTVRTFLVLNTPVDRLFVLEYEKAFYIMHGHNQRKDMEIFF